VRRLRLPADWQCAEVVVPAVRALDHPATRPTALALASILAAASKVRLDAARANSSLCVVIVVTLVEAKVLRAAGPAGRGDNHRIEWSGPALVDTLAQGRGEKSEETQISDPRTLTIFLLLT
jgi:hypothetical protein